MSLDEPALAIEVVDGLYDHFAAQEKDARIQGWKDDHFRSSRACIAWIKRRCRVASLLEQTPCDPETPPRAIHPAEVVRGQSEKWTNTSGILLTPLTSIASKSSCATFGLCLSLRVKFTSRVHSSCGPTKRWPGRHRARTAGLLRCLPSFQPGGGMRRQGVGTAASWLAFFPNSGDGQP